MRVLQVSCEGLGNGGVQSVIMNTCRNLPEIQFDVLLFTNEKRYYDNEFEHLGGKIYRIPKYEGNKRFIKKLDYYIRFFRIFSGTYKLIKHEGNYDAIHCHNDLESGICNLAAFFAGIKIRISHAHTSTDIFSKTNIIANIYRKILHSLMNLTSNIKIGCSEESFKSIFGEKHLSKKNSYIIPNAIDLKRFTKSKKTSKKRTVFNIVHVGRYCENKNQLFIIDLLPYIMKDAQNIRLKLVGWGDEYRNILKRRIKELNLHKHIEFLPSNSDIKEVLEDADVFILPSKKEGFGIVLLEAQAMQVPCLVSDTVPEIVDYGLCKFISLNENKQVWSDSVINILTANHNLKLKTDKLKKLDISNYVSFIKSLYGGKKYESWDTYFS